MARWKTNLIALVLVLSTACNAIAQTASETEQAIRKIFPDNSAVYLERSTTLTLSIEGDSLKSYEDVFEDILHLKNQTEMYANGKVYGSHFNQVENIRAKTLVWDKSRYKEIPVNNYKKNSAPQDHVFYDDSYFYSFNYPAVASGNRTQLEYREIQKDARFLSGYIFTSFIPQIKSVYTIKTPKEVDIHFEVLNDPGNKIRFKKTEKGNLITYQWTAENVREFKVEEGSPSLRFYEPHLICYVKSFKGKGGTYQMLPDVKGLYNWYYSIVKDVIDEQAPSEELVGVVNSIKSKTSKEEELVRQIFYWVQENIHYIAFEQGMRGYVPHKASYTLEKKYGDCKDMANLIVGMLKVAGVKAYPTWIGTRDLPYTYSSVPTPLTDNHMIATYISPSGRYYFLDATGRYTPFGFPTSMIQGKQALISKGPGDFEVHEVPAVERKLNRITDSLTVTLDGNTLTGAGVSRLYGLAKANAGPNLERIEQKDIKDFVLRLVGKGSNKFFLDGYNVLDWNTYDKPTDIRYQFRIGDYCQRVGDEVYINLNLSKDNQNRVINEQLRRTPHEFEYKYDKIENIELTIPDGYVVDYLPPDDSFDGKLLGYRAQYKVVGKKIRYVKQYYIDYLLMTPDQFKIWNEEVTKISNMYQETVILKKKI